MKLLSLTILFTICLGVSKTLLYLPMDRGVVLSDSKDTHVEIKEDDEGVIRQTYTSSKIDAQTVDFLFKETLSADYSGKIVFPDSAEKSCEDVNCARELGKKYMADEVIYAVIKKLGIKVIFSATHVDLQSGNANNQKISASSIEEMDDVTKRMSDALLAKKGVKEVATLDNVVDNENRKIMKRRETYYKKGLTIGYLFPMNGSYTRWNQELFQDDYTEKEYSQVIYLNMVNMWEFQGNLALDIDLNFAIPVDLGVDANLLYFMKRTDFSPFFGGGLGLHYVMDGCADSDCPEYDSDERHSGPTLNAQVGYALFRTYSVNLITRVKYQMVMNSNWDHGPVVEVGIVHHRKDSKKSSSGWSFWKWYLVMALVASIATSAID